MANQLAVNSPDVSAVVPYYGRQPASEDVPKIKASLLLQYAGNDEGIDKGIPAYVEALNKAHVDYKLYMYEGAQHAFNNDTKPGPVRQGGCRPRLEAHDSFLEGEIKDVGIRRPLPGASLSHAAFLIFPAAAAGTWVVAARSCAPRTGGLAAGRIPSPSACPVSDKAATCVMKGPQCVKKRL